MYFEKLPKIKYNFPNISSELEMQDIFRRVNFTTQTLRAAGNFETYFVTEGESVDDVATKFYGDPRWWWLVLLSNNIIDMENEWSKSFKELDSLFSNFSLVISITSL